MRKNTNGWVLSDFKTYQEAYFRFGGSVCSHPDVIHFLCENGAAPEFYAYKENGAVISATYVSKGHISVHCGPFPFVFDDIIIPRNKNAGKIILPFKTKQLSPYHVGDFYNCIYWRGLKRKTCVVKREFSRSTHKKRQAAVKRFIQAGGCVRPVEAFTDQELCDIYISLFKKRWGDTLPCYGEAALLAVFGALRHLVFGVVLLMDGVPCAYDLIFRAECRQWCFYDCINGGYDPVYSDLSVGSILMCLNIQQAREECQKNNIKMAFSLGMDNPRWEYKKQWCDIFTLGRSLPF